MQNFIKKYGYIILTLIVASAICVLVFLKDEEHTHEFVEGVCSCGEQENVEVYYDVEFVDYDGTILKKERVLSGYSATAPNSPARSGFVFSGWSAEFICVTSDLVITAMYEETHEHKFVDGICSCGVSETYTLYIDSKDGSKPKEYILAPNTKINIDIEPVKDYCQFLGWILENGQEVPSVMPNDNLHVIAKWYDIRDDYQVSGNTLSRYLGSEEIVVIPKEYYLNGSIQKIEKLDSDLFDSNNNIITAKVIIHENIQEISYLAFNDLQTLKEIIVDEDNMHYSSIDGVLYNKNQTILIHYPSKKPGKEYTTLDTVKEIATYAFSRNNEIETITLTDSVEVLNHFAIYGCNNLINIYISENINTIVDTFYISCPNVQFTEYNNCQYLGSKDNPYIVLWKFLDNQLTNLSIHPNTKIIFQQSFKESKGIADIRISGEGKYYTSIDGVIYSKDLKTLVLYPRRRSNTYYEIVDGCEEILSNALFGAKFTTIKLPNSLKNISGTSFGNSVYISEFIVDENNPYFSTIDGSLLSKDGSILYRYAVGKSSQSYKVPEGVKLIYDYAFSYALNLVSLDLSSSVEELGEYSVSNCPLLKELSGQDALISIGAYAFLNDVIEYIEFYDGLETIGDSAFGQCLSLKAISLPNTVTSIGEYAFHYCQSLESIEIPDGVRTIRRSTFGYCHNLTSVILPTSLETIDTSGFTNCTSLTNIELPNGLLVIGSSAFYKSGLEAINIPNTVLEIGSSAFSRCDKITEFIVPNSVVRLGKRIFYSSYELKLVYIPKSVLYIEGIVADDCYNVVIKCEVSEKPDGWADDWKETYQNVYWNISNE